MGKKKIIAEKLAELFARYDSTESMITEYRQVAAGGYHTLRTGILHNLRDSIEFASFVLFFHEEQYYQSAFKTITKICSLQERTAGSPTYGLWPYYLEEPLSEMKNPDYNWADFIGKYLVCILKENFLQLPAELIDKMHVAIDSAIQCSLQRNVGLDYTNISLMSCLLLLAGGEVLSREDYIQAGKTKLRSILHYTQMNTGFSEYNSSSYTWVSLFEIVRMKRYFRDFNDREIATNLECIVWKMVAKHYNTELLQLTPPQARSYRDLDNGFYSLMVAIGTSGKYGRIPKLSVVSVEALMLWPRCPATVLSEFIPTTRWLVDYFYRRNDLRQSNEDHVIIRELDSPDRVGYSYKTSTYSLGCFGVSDCWNQRRNAMVIWGDGAHAGFLRVRGMIDDYDFSSAMLYCTQSKNRLLGHLGYCWDRGSFHYILDNDGKGEYVGSKLYFCVEYHLCPGDRVKFQDGQLLIEGQSTNTIVTFRRWQINGQNGRIWHDAARHRVVLLVKTGDGQLNLRALAKGISGVFTIDVNASPAPVTTMDEHGILHSELTMPNHQLKLVSPSNIGRYADAVQISMAGREHNDVK